MTGTLGSGWRATASSALPAPPLDEERLPWKPPAIPPPSGAHDKQRPRGSARRKRAGSYLKVVLPVGSGTMREHRPWPWDRIADDREQPRRAAPHQSGPWRSALPDAPRAQDAAQIGRASW